MIAPVKSLKGRDFIDVADLDRTQLRGVLDLAHAIKGGRWLKRPLEGRHVAMLFQKPSHRTRVSFEVGIARLGGSTTTLTENDVQLGVRETIPDAARVSEQHLVYIGDGNNVANSLIEAAALTNLNLTVITPAGYEPAAAVIERARSIDSGTPKITVTNDINATDGATAIYTDVWASMGQESEREVRRRAFMEYQVDAEVMDAAPGAVFMHCLPAHRGEEVADDVIDGPRSVVFQQAGNRLYAQMALLAELFVT